MYMLTVLFSDTLLYKKVAEANFIYELNFSTLILRCQSKNFLKEELIDLMVIYFASCTFS